MGTEYQISNDGSLYIAVIPSDGVTDDSDSLLPKCNLYCFGHAYTHKPGNVKKWKNRFHKVHLLE